MTKQVYAIEYRKDNYGSSTDKSDKTWVSAETLEEATAMAPAEIARHLYKNQKYTIIKVFPARETAPLVRVEDVTRMFPFSTYYTDVDLDYIEVSLARYKEHYNLDLDPDFQRAHVWTEEQQIAFVEYALRGGVSGKDIYFNAAEWQGRGKVGDMVLVDGKQRLTAMRRFVANDLVIFGKYKYEDFFHASYRFKFHVNNLATRKEVLQWYVDFNEGHVPHTEEEIAKVKKLIIEEPSQP